MKLLSIASARSVWLFPFNDLNPRGKALMPMLQPLIERYKFIKFPQKPEELVSSSTNPLEFHEGAYTTKEGNEIVVNLRVYNDGLIADSRSSTADSDAFLHDLLSWGSEAYGLTNYAKVIRRKLYTSELHVQMEKSLRLINPAIKKSRINWLNMILAMGHSPLKSQGLVLGKTLKKYKVENGHFD